MSRLPLVWSDAMESMPAPFSRMMTSIDSRSDFESPLSNAILRFPSGSADDRRGFNVCRGATAGCVLGFDFGSFGAGASLPRWSLLRIGLGSNGGGDATEPG